MGEGGNGRCNVLCLTESSVLRNRVIYSIFIFNCNHFGNFQASFSGLLCIADDRGIGERTLGTMQKPVSLHVISTGDAHGPKPTTKHIWTMNRLRRRVVWCGWM